MEYTTTEWNQKKIIVGESEIDPSQPLRLLIGFHGADSTPENMLIHAGKLNLNNTALLFPEAPIDAGKGLWSWWKDGPKQKETVGDFLKFTENLVESGRDWASKKSDQCEIHLWGFSQGGAAALVYSLLGSHKIHKSAAICGFLPEMPEVTPATEKPSGNILGIYGLNDDVVPSFLAEFALDEIKGQGHNVKIIETNQGHEVTEDNLSKLTEFFSSH